MVLSAVIPPVGLAVLCASIHRPVGPITLHSYPAAAYQVDVSGGVLTLAAVPQGAVQQILPGGDRICHNQSTWAQAGGVRGLALTTGQGLRPELRAAVWWGCEQGKGCCLFRGMLKHGMPALGTEAYLLREVCGGVGSAVLAHVHELC